MYKEEHGVNSEAAIPVYICIDINGKQICNIILG